MSDYTPTTVEVRDAWRNSTFDALDGTEFDRWLNKIKAEAWDEGYASAPVGPHPRRENPYREEPWNAD